MTPQDHDRDISAVEIAKLEGRMDAGFAEVGGKLDTLIAKQDAAESKRADDRATADRRHEDHETRIRNLETRASAQESRSVVTPKGMWAAIVGGGTLLIGAAAVIINAIQ